MENNYAELSRELHETFSKGQMDKTLAMVSEKIEIHAYAFGMSFHGKSGFETFMQSFKSAFPDIRIEHKTILSQGNRVAVEFTAVGTHQGALQTPAGPIPATGKTVTFTVAEFLEWEDGKLLSLHNYQDAGSILRQIGVM